MADASDSPQSCGLSAVTRPASEKAALEQGLSEEWATLCTWQPGVRRSKSRPEGAVSRFRGRSVDPAMTQVSLLSGTSLCNANALRAHELEDRSCISLRAVDLSSVARQCIATWPLGT